MEMIDVVFEQVRKDSHNKKVVETMADRVKCILANAMPDEYNAIDLPVDHLVDAITTIRRAVKKPKRTDGNYQTLEEMLKYQKAFYMLSDESDAKLMLNYRNYLKHHKEIYKTVCDELAKLDSLELRYRIDMSKPLPVSIKGIEEYCDSLKIALKSLYKLVTAELAEDCKGLGPFLMFHEEAYGNPKAGRKTLNRWKACREAYVRHHMRGEKKADIVRDLYASPLAPLYSFNLKGDASNASAKLTTFIDEAERLIASAERGTFPY